MLLLSLAFNCTLFALSFNNFAIQSIFFSFCFFLFSDLSIALHCFIVFVVAFQSSISCCKVRNHAKHMISTVLTADAQHLSLVTRS